MTDVSVILGADNLTDLLRCAGHDVSVSGVTAEPVGTGQMAASYRLGLTFDGDPGEIPPTLIGKIARGSVERRAIAAGSYRTEVGFYRSIAPRTSLRIPRCFASWMTDDAHEFVLLLEDLAPRTPGDQLLGCTVEQALNAAINLAGLHGPLWNDPWLREVLPSFDQEQADSLDEVFPSMVEIFLTNNGHRLSATTRTLYEELGPVAGTWLAGRPEPFAAVHGDYRLDNLLFDPDGDEVAAVDWQTTSLGLPGRDLAFLLGTGLDTADRRASEDDIIAAYHRALVGHGVTDHNLSACRTDYAYGMLHAPLVVVFGSAVAEGSDRGDAMFAVMAERSAAALVDLGTLDLLSEISRPPRSAPSR